MTVHSDNCMPLQEHKCNTSSYTLSPHEDALQSLSKQILKSRFFRGVYQERRYVETVNGYRDIVTLHSSERDLRKILLDMKQKLQLFYQYNPNKWIGVTQENPTAGALDIHIWTELDDLAFGQYWFTVKSIRFREQEIIIKLKMVRVADSEGREEQQQSVYRRALQNTTSSISEGINDNDDDDETIIANEITVKESNVPDVNLQDFIEIIKQWGTSTKLTTYRFLSNDVNKENIVGALRFIGLIIVGLLSFTLVGIKYLGAFVLRFMFEFSRLLHVLTPILLKVIDVISKIFGGFYILLAMLWRDIFGGGRGQNGPMNSPAALQYNKPMYKSIEYKVRQNRSGRIY